MRWDGMGCDGIFSPLRGSGPIVVASTAEFQGSFPGLCGLKETKMFLYHSLVIISIGGASVTER